MAKHKRSTAYRARKRTHKLKVMIKRQEELEEKREVKYGTTTTATSGYAR